MMHCILKILPVLTDLHCNCIADLLDLHYKATSEGESRMTNETTKISDEEFEIHVRTLAHENWATEHGNAWPASEAEWAEADEWARLLRQSYDAGELDAGWR